MFNYSQIESDFHNQIVRECRGSILEDKTFRPVCFPFYKFGNYGEGYVDVIDWDTAKVQEKIDGSLIKLWNYNEEWRVSTNGMIDARDAELSSDICEYKTFYDLFMKAAENVGLDFNNLDASYTYLFELISPFNKVVVPHREISLVHIGTRNMQTLQEIEIDIGLPKPKQYSFSCLEECIQVAQELPFNEEGYVVVDANWNRVKIKSPAYVAVHHLRNNGVVTKSRVVDLVRRNEHEEFLNYYPEFKDAFEKIIASINQFVSDMEWCIECAKEDNKLDNRKRFAEFAKTTKCPPLLFSWLDKKISTAKEWLYNQTNDKIVQWIGE